MSKNIILPVIIPSLLLCFLFLFVSATLAEKATVDEMDLVGHNWLSQIVFEKTNWSTVTNPKIDRVDDIIVNDTLLGRVYAVAPEGYIIVPVLKELPPVEVYSDEGFYNVGEPDGFPALVREVLQNRVRNFVNRYGTLEYSTARDNEASFTMERKKWSDLTVSQSEFKSNLGKKSSSIATAGPLLTTRWHQNAPYNNFCPWGDGGRTLVGCVATATAQILAYHDWPPEGTGQHSYYWSGDMSCDGSSSGANLEADYSDPYDWANMPDYCTNCNEAQRNALAELCYEVGVAFNMDYGYCGSGAYTADALYVFPTYFRYLDITDREDRNMHSAASWFYTIASEIDTGRPMQYRISNHSIVCDGWQQVEELNQVHMNYGWGGSYNAWFTVDNLHCSWDGCDPMVEYLIRYIVPDKGVNFTADTTIGWAPFEVHFTGESELAVDIWTWDFGDGDSGNVQNPNHFYEEPGIYDVKLEVNAQGDIRSYIKSDFIISLADSLIGTDVEGPLDSIMDIPIIAANITPLNRIILPVKYDGPLNLKYQGYSVAGCRTENFDEINYLHYNGSTKCFTLDMNIGTASDLEPGRGPIVILEFKILSASVPGVDTTSIKIDGYTDGANTFVPWFYSFLADYEPRLSPGVVTYSGCCVGLTGNVDCSPNDEPDISDITRLIDFLYTSHAPLCCPDEADCDGSGGEPDIADITAIIDYLYISNDPLAPCQ